MSKLPIEPVENTRIASLEVLTPPQQLKKELPADPAVLSQVAAHRKVLRDIIDGKDHRLFVVTGPCSIHNPQEAEQYARKLAILAEELADSLFIIMRVYFEKPRTTVGWKGLINDPDLNDSFQVEKGLRQARKLLLTINALGLPAATEALDPIGPQYLQDLFSWTAIGARTTESQTHREMASGLSTPVGFKNSTEGDIGVVVNALLSARQPHRFLGINEEGRVAVVQTTGNAYPHTVLRGGNKGPNYSSREITATENILKKAGEPPRIVVDCSHANSSKIHENQPQVLADVCTQIEAGNKSIVGVMLESNLEAGRQDIPDDISQLRPGVSITDACIDWDSTEKILRDMHRRLHTVLPARISATAST